MRFLKYIFIPVLLLAITLVTAFYSRSSMVTSVVNNYLTEHSSAITCIAFDVNSNLDLQISKLCIDSPYAGIELTDLLIEWQFEANNLTTNKLAEAITAINIASANVRAKTDFKFPTKPQKSPLSLREFPELIRSQFIALAELSPPFEVAIQSVSYQPYNKENEESDKSGKNQQNSPSYQGQFSTNAQLTSFFLANKNQQNILSVQLAKKNQGDSTSLAGEVSADLAKISVLLGHHQSLLPTSLSTLLSKKDTKHWSLMGEFSSKVTWQNQTLNMASQLNNVSFIAQKDITPLGPIKLDATLAWNTQLQGDHLRVEFTNGEEQSNKLQLEFNQKKLMESLLEAKVRQQQTDQLLTFLSDNVIKDISLLPIGAIEVDFSKQSITSDGITLSSRHLNAPLALSLNNLAFSYHDEMALAANLQQGQFLLAGKANVAQLQPYSTQAVRFNIAGDIAQQSEFWQLQLNSKTSVSLSHLSMPTAQASVKSFTSYLQGNINIGKSNLSSQNNSAEVTFDLEVNNKIKQLKLAETIHIKTLELNSELSGNVDNISLNAMVIADNLHIASAKLTGDIREPQIELFANDVFLTDALALKLKLPLELKLIDGTLSYHLSGQVRNTENLLANPISLAVSIKDLTGEVDGTWLQELNWQQDFVMQNAQLKSFSKDNKAENNLTIAKIETATPITKLSTNTVLDFSQGKFNLKVNNTSGNLLGGSFDIAQAQWPFSKALAVEVKLTKIDLEKLLELDKQQGIVVTGRVSGQFPIYYDGDDFLIKAGSLHNVGSGIIQVYNNPAVEELKSSSTELKLAFNALENLHYHRLTSAVSMADDGYMLLVTEIKGRNPDLDNEVNLNLNLSYDLLGLLESLNITEHFESKVIKGLKR